MIDKTPDQLWDLSIAAYEGRVTHEERVESNLEYISSALLHIAASLAEISASLQIR